MQNNKLFHDLIRFYRKKRNFTFIFLGKNRNLGKCSGEKEKTESSFKNYQDFFQKIKVKLKVKKVPTLLLFYPLSFFFLQKRISKVKKGKSKK